MCNKRNGTGRAHALFGEEVGDAAADDTSAEDNNLLLFSNIGRGWGVGGRCGGGDGDRGGGGVATGGAALTGAPSKKALLRMRGSRGIGTGSLWEDDAGRQRHDDDDGRCLFPFIFALLFVFLGAGRGWSQSSKILRYKII